MTLLFIVRTRLNTTKTCQLSNSKLSKVENKKFEISPQVPPAAFSGLSALTSLSLTNSGVRSLPSPPEESPFCSLSGLESLNLSGNALRDVADLGFSKELGDSCGLPITSLDLSRNYIDRLPRYNFMCL